jgi:hypothetical protein
VNELGPVGPIEEESAVLEHRLFWTQKGYVGIGSPAVEVGDYVAILYGGQVPYILRARKELDRDDVEFSSECFVHGLMYGEALQFDGKDGVTSRSWNIF